MNSKNNKIVGIVFILAIIVVVIFAMKTKNEFADLPSLGLPPDWYAHRVNDTTTIFTKEKNPPSKEDPTSERITIYTEKLDRPMEEWATWRAPEPKDDPLVISKQWSTLNGYKVLRVEREPGPAGGKTLEYNVFKDDTVYIFVFHPLETYDVASGKTIRNTTDIQILKQIVKEYADNKI